MALIITYGNGGQGGQLECLSKLLFGRGGNITSSSAGVITATNHGLAQWSSVVISDHSVSAYNGTWIVNTVTPPNQFSLISACGGSVPSGAGTGGVWSIAGMENAQLRIFSNVLAAIPENATVASFTEATFPGYTAGGITLVSKLCGPSGAAGWKMPITVANTWAPTTGGINANIWESTQPAVSWLVGGPPPTFTNIYGYYVVGAVTGQLWWAEMFAGAPTVIHPSDTFQLTPRFGLAHYP